MIGMFLANKLEEQHSHEPTTRLRWRMEESNHSIESRQKDMDLFSTTKHMHHTMTSASKRLLLSVLGLLQYGSHHFLTLTTVLVLIGTTPLATTTAFQVVNPSFVGLRLSGRGILSPMPVSQRGSGMVILYNVIEPEAVDFDFNVGQGGVQLAQESIIKIKGKVPLSTKKSADASAQQPTITDLLRYTRIVEIDEEVVKAGLARSGAQILATGSGRELYQDPGTSTDQVIFYAPTEAVRSAMASSPSMAASMASMTESTTLYVNFCGGDDAQVLEVLSAVTELVESLDNSATFKSIQFHSISHETFALGSSAVTVVAVPDKKASAEDGESSSSSGGNDSEQESVLRTVASGEVYVSPEGRYYTLLEQDSNPAIA
jgi:hypothetical protein